MQTHKKVLITGSSKGIGKAIAEKLTSQGWEVIGLSRQDINMEDLDTLPSKLKKLKEIIGTVDAIIANAGKGHFGHLEECSFEQIESLFHVNVLSHIYLVKTFLPEMKRQNSGDIIFIGSEAALQGKRKGSLYCASKFAIRGFSQALREDCSVNNIRVTLINPGMVQTSFFDSLQFRPGEEADEHIKPEDIAETVAMILKIRRGTVIDEINLSPQKKTFVKEPFSHQLPKS